MTRGARRATRPAEVPDGPPLRLGPISPGQDISVFLEANGQVACSNGFRWPGTKDYPRFYAFCLEFLQCKRLPPDVSRFREKGLMDVIGEMEGTKRETITRDELVEVAHPNNHIAMIREAILRDTRAAQDRTLYPRPRKRSASRRRPPWDPELE